MKVSENSFRTEYYFCFTKYLNIYFKYYWFIAIMLKDGKIVQI